MNAETIATLRRRIETEHGWIGVSKDTLTELLDIAEVEVDPDDRTDRRCALCGRTMTEPEGQASGWVNGELFEFELCHPAMSTGPTCYSKVSGRIAEAGAYSRVDDLLADRL